MPFEIQRRNESRQRKNIQTTSATNTGTNKFWKPINNNIGMDYIGEHLLPGQLGHFFIVLSLVASLIATFSYFKSAQSKNDEDAAHWKKLARYAFITEVISVVCHFRYFILHHSQSPV